MAGPRGRYTFLGYDPTMEITQTGGGSNAIGSFYHFIGDESVRLIGCEAAGRGIDTFETAATVNTGRLGIFHGMKSYFCQDKYGQIAPVYSISAGLDYPGIGPEHAHLHDIGRAEYVPVTDDEVVNAFEYLAKTEGIIPAIESAHAVAYAMKLAPQMDKDQIMVITISGRGDKDCAAIARYRGEITAAVVRAAAANGADLIELGIIRKRRPRAGGRLCKIHAGCGAGGIESRHCSL